MVMPGVHNNQQTANNLKTTEIKSDLYSILKSCVYEKGDTKSNIKINNPTFLNSRLGGGTVV